MILLMDGGNLAMRCLFSSRDVMGDFRLFRFIYFQTLFANIKRYLPMGLDEVVLAIDGKGYWRRKIYPDYKISRKQKRKDSVVNFNEFFNVLNELTERIKTHLPIKILQIPMVEADDIIAVLATDIENQRKKIIVSSDGDFKQLLNVPNLKIWNPINKQWIKSDNPKRELEIKILAGDKGDEVPPVKRGIGQSRAESILDDEGSERFVKNEGLQLEYDRNMKLVSLFDLPDVIVNEIRKRYKNYRYPIIKVHEFIDHYYFKYFIDRIEMTEGIFHGLCASIASNSR